MRAPEPTMEEPFSFDDPNAWGAAIEAASPAAVLVAIQSRMDALSRGHVTAEDIWQETLLRAWRGRTGFTWQGTSSFRRWLLTIAENCLADHRDHLRADKRDVGRTRRLERESSSDAPMVGPWVTTTPSGLAGAAERARAMAAALAELPDEVRDVVRMRLFDELTVPEIAVALGLGESAVRHRFRRGAESYRVRLKGLLESSGLDARPPTR
jgi:RNA polymerase sigma-70 factor (ECF subfamily)